MLFAYCICATSVQSFNLVSIRCLQWSKYPNITGLEFMGSMGRDTAEGYVVFETKLQDLKGLVRSKAIANQNARSLSHLFLVWGSNTRLSHSKLILESIYPDSEHA